MQIYQILRAGSHFIVAILLVKIGLGKAEIGQYEWMLWLGTFCTTFWINALLQTLPFTRSQLPTERQDAFVRGTFMLFSLAGAVILLALAMAHPIVLPLATGLPQLPGLNWFLLHLIFHVGTYPVEIWYLIKQDGKAIIYWGLATFMVASAALLLPIWLTGDLQTGLMFLAAFSALRWVFAAWLAFRAGRSLPYRADLALWLRTATPMIGQAFIAHLIISYDAWLLGQYQADSSTFALFRYASREFPLSLAMSTALGISMLPMLSGGWRGAHLNDQLAIMRSKTNYLMAIVFPVGILLVCFAKPLFVLAFDDTFAAAAPIFSVYMLLTLARVLLPTTLLIAKGDTKPLFFISILELCLKVVSGYLFYHWFGLIGLAWSAVLCSVFDKFCVAAYLHHRYSVAIWQYVDMWRYLIWCGLLVASVVWYG
jgi:O-antigen/teichoic acid export membrane protein